MANIKEAAVNSAFKGDGPHVSSSEQGEALAARVNNLYTSFSCEELIPYEERAQTFWEGVKTSPDELAIGVACLIKHLPIGAAETPQAQDTRRLLRELLGQRIKGHLSTKSADVAFEYHVSLYPVLIHGLSLEAYEVPKAARQFLLLSVMRWEQDRQLLLLVEGFNMQDTMGVGLYQSMNTYHAKYGDAVALGREEKRVRNDSLSQQDFYDEQVKIHGVFLRIMDKFEARREKGVMDAKMLKLAVLLLSVNRTMTVVSLPANQKTRVIDIGVSYIRDFIQYFRRQGDDGHLLAIQTITDALHGTPHILKNSIAGFLVDDAISIKDPRMGFEVRDSFAPFFHKLLANLADGKTQERKQALCDLLESTAYETSIAGEDEPIKDNVLLALIAHSTSFTEQERILLAKGYLDSLKRHGFAVDIELLSETTLLNIVNGLWGLLCVPAVDGQKITIGETGDVVGHFQDPKKRESVSRNGASPKTDKKEKEGIVFEELAQISPTTEETKPPTREEKIIEQLRKIFPREISDEDTEELEKKVKTLWQTLDLRSFRRARTLNPRGNRVKLGTERAIRAEEDQFPSVKFRRGEEIQIDGAFASDIWGTLSLEKDLNLPFFLDKNGYLQGEPAQLLNKGLLPWDLYWQLNARVVSFAYKLLIIDEETLVRRAHAVAEHATDEILEEGTKDRKKKASLLKIRERLEASKKFLLPAMNGNLPANIALIETIEDTGATNPQAAIDLDTVLGEMDRTGRSSVTVWQELTPQQLDGWEKQGRRGKVNPNPTAGHISFLPYGKSPTKTAIGNARQFGVMPIQVTEISRDSLGVITETVVKSTFTSASKPEEVDK